MTRLRIFLALLAALVVLAAPANARADAVTDWNLYASTALGPVFPSVLNMAIVQGAVYDAVNAIERGYQPYLAAPPANMSDSADAAAATAAYRVLVWLLPGQLATLTTTYDNYIAVLPDDPPGAKAAGIAIGTAAANAMIAARTGDGRFAEPRMFPVGTDPGEWRPVPPLLGNDFRWVGHVKPFMMLSPDQFPSDGPNALTSAAYAEDFAEVKAKGSLTSTVRTADETEAARFWAAGALLWAGALRQLSAAHDLTLAENARSFAMFYLSGADAAISCWNDKERWLFWRPYTAIHEAAFDGNPATAPDANWTSLLPTPPYPDHPSGHLCISTAYARTLQDFFGTNNESFSITSPTSGTTRSFTHFSDAVSEIIDARINSGYHFRTADVQGSIIGKKVAHWRQQHYFHATR
jgi:PAP2 superfamily